MNYRNIGDSMIKTLLTSDFTKRKLNKLTLLCMTLIVRSIINLFLTSLTYSGIIYIDFVLEILISIFLVLKTNQILQLLKTYEKDILSVSSYFIDNYTPENFRTWKKYIVLFFSTYYIIYLLIYPIDSRILILYIVQFLICYFIVENIENRAGLIFDAYHKITEINYAKKDDIVIVDNEYENINVDDFVIFDQN